MRTNNGQEVTRITDDSTTAGPQTSMTISSIKRECKELNLNMYRDPSLLFGNEILHS